MYKNCFVTACDNFHNFIKATLIFFLIFCLGITPLPLDILKKKYNIFTGM